MSVRALWLAWRNKTLQNQRFQRFAADFPLTRFIARRSADELFDLVAGFVYAQTLAAFLRLDLFRTLAQAPLTANEIAVRCDLPEHSIERLLEAGCALALIEPIGKRYTLGRHGAALLGNAGLAEMIAHNAHFYADLQDPIALLRRGRGERLTGYWPYATAQAKSANADVGAYSALMAATQPGVAADILDAYPMRRHRVLMDVGGGEGVFLSVAGGRWPHLDLRLFDLPAVVARARAINPTLSAVEGDFLSDPLPGGADLITLVRILHDHDDIGVARILSSARAALAPGGRMLIAEPMRDLRGPSRLAGGYLSLYLLAMGRGRPRAPLEYSAFVRNAGFRRSRMLRVRTPALLQILLAEA